jgi:hypothetical protein
VADPIPPAAQRPVEELRERAAALKHDLGKYVAWRSANLPESAWTGPIDESTLQSIRADVLATRSGPGEPEPAWALFERLAQPWPQPWPPELVAVAAAVTSLRKHASALATEDRDAIAAARGAIRSAQHAIRGELAALYRRLMRET